MHPLSSIIAYASGSPFELGEDGETLSSVHNSQKPQGHWTKILRFLLLLFYAFSTNAHWLITGRNIKYPQARANLRWYETYKYIYRLVQAYNPKFLG